MPDFRIFHLVYMELLCYKQQYTNTKNGNALHGRYLLTLRFDCDKSTLCS